MAFGVTASKLRLEGNDSDHYWETFYNQDAEVMIWNKDGQERIKLYDFPSVFSFSVETGMNIQFFI